MTMVACQGGSPAPPNPSATSNASAVANGNVAAVPLPVPPPVLELKGTAAFAAAGPSAASLSAGSETSVDPRAVFRVELPIPLPDARLSLLDGDAMVASSGGREVGLATVLTLTPSVKLAPGARLRLRVDGAATRELHADDGRRFAPLEWPVVVTGDPEPKKGPGRKVKRR
jgi:hypothetical protein